MSNKNAKPKTKLDPYTRESQSRASDPVNSAWVSANAGSGKTYVLTQRVVRLLLAGFDPSRILCLTFTKSAAAEMSNRVFDILASWAVKDEDELVDDLKELNGVPPTSKQMREARRLFARALETPGGLKIQTIHAFCEALLHQFPLEANIAGHFEIMDDRTQQELISNARKQVIVKAGLDHDGALGRSFSRLIDLASDTKIDESITEFIKKRHSLGLWLEQVGGAANAMANVREQSGFAANETVETLIEGALGKLVLTPLELREIAEAGDATGVKTNQAFATSLRALLAANSAQARFEKLEQIFLTKAGELRKPGGIYTKKLSDLIPELIERVSGEMNNFIQLRERLNLLGQIEASRALFIIAEAIIGGFEKVKRARGLLDFDDLIIRSANLLGRSNARQWVQYKLDQGIDHVLVDEAQDTNPHQWKVITALIEEFFSGKGAREIERTVFAVGDEKQSIYSFQGAEPAAFADQRDRLKELSGKVDKKFEDINLRLSFRSVPDVLSAVDEVFSELENYSGLSRDCEPTVHNTVRYSHPGMVDIWPMIAKIPQEEPENWIEPVDQLTQNDPQIQLANKIAAQIQEWLAQETILEGKGRPIHAGDILILVRSRDRFASALTRELKQRNIPVAGSDRLRLTDHIAVMDLLALVRVVLRPQDDLSLAAVLKSPLFGFDEDLLLKLAHGRGPTSLYSALQKFAQKNQIADAALQQLDMLQNRADNMPVYEFFAQLLGADGGRRKILARIGREAEDVLDAFLAQTFIHEQSELPGLESFVDWLQSSAPEIKREFDLKDNTIKIMTVHAAKGLEAPIVFLADKGAPPYHGRYDPAIVTIGQSSGSGENTPAFLWITDKKSASLASLEALAKIKYQAEAEYMRLLYVAMTRAEDRLIICGTCGSNGPNEMSWHKVVCRALLDKSSEHLNEKGKLAFHRWQLERMLSAVDNADEREASPYHPVDLPEWLDEPAKREAELPRPLTPSGAQAMIDAQDWGALPQSPLLREAKNPSFALQRGIAIHRLLQTLPDMGNIDDRENWSSQRRKAAHRYLSVSYPKWNSVDTDQVVIEVFSILEDPEFNQLFEPGSSGAEIAISGTIELGSTPRLISGQIDRLIVSDKQVVIVDYKTNRLPPVSASDISEAYISQLALYQLLVRRIYPDHSVNAALLWSETPALMFVPQALLDKQLSKLAK